MLYSSFYLSQVEVRLFFEWVQSVWHHGPRTSDRLGLAVALHMMENREGWRALVKNTAASTGQERTRVPMNYSVAFGNNSVVFTSWNEADSSKYKENDTLCSTVGKSSCIYTPAEQPCKNKNINPSYIIAVLCPQFFECQCQPSNCLEQAWLLKYRISSYQTIIQINISSYRQFQEFQKFKEN